MATWIKIWEDPITEALRSGEATRGEAVARLNAGAPRMWRSSFPAMGTRIDVVGWGGNGMSIVDAIVSLIARYEDAWSVFRADSDISRLNAAARKACGTDARTNARPPAREAPESVHVEAHTDALLSDALALSRSTGGVFTPLVGSLVQLWDVKGYEKAISAGKTPPPAPAPEAVRAALGACDSSLLRRVGKCRWVLGASVMVPRLDLGGIAKGRAADDARDLAVTMGARGIMVSVGTSSIAVAGNRPGGGAWRVGLRDPMGGEASYTTVVELPHQGMASLSTSGDNLGPLLPAWNRAHVRETERETLRHHILDPRTGYPARAPARQISVAATSGVLAEALSTALLIDATCVNDEAVAAWVEKDTTASARGAREAWQIVGSAE